MEYSLLKRCYIANYEEQKFEYRITRAPHIICADPLCGKIFAYNESYIEHIDEMMINNKQQKCKTGTKLKNDINSALSERK